jgi:hypothetical protein
VCSCRTVYNDFETRKGWQLIVQSTINVLRVSLKVENLMSNLLNL